MSSQKFIRNCAVWCAVGALLNIALGVIGVVSFDLVHTTLWLLLEIPLYVVFLAGLVGLALSRAVGNSAWGKFSIGVAIVGLALYIPGEIGWVLNAKVPAQFFFAIGTLLNALGMLATGFAVIQAKKWQGWHAFTPFLWGLHPIVVQFPAFALGQAAISLALGSWGICMLLLSVALWQEASREAGQHLPLTKIGTITR